MSSARVASKAKISAPGSVASKKAGASSATSAALTDSTNLHNGSTAKKTSTLSHPRTSMVPSSLATPITPRSGFQSTTARVPASLKQAEAASKNTTQVHKVIDTWAPMPTPVAISSSRSFSELMKSEESLLSRVTQLQALLDQQQKALVEKDCEIKQLRMEVVSGQEQATKIHRAWEAKSEALLSQQQEKYQDLNDRYLVVLTRARACESKLEELFVDPLTLDSFEKPVLAESGLQQQRSILNLVEEHQRKEDSLVERNQRETEQLLAQTMKEIGKKHEIDAEDFLDSIRASIPTHTDEALKKIELSVPKLFIDVQLNNQLQITDDDSENLDWSIATSDDAHEYPRAPQNEDLTPYTMDPEQILEFTPWRIEGTAENEDDFESGADDSFFNESIHEAS